MESPLTHQALKDSHYDLLKLSEVYFMTVRDLKLFFSLFFPIIYAENALFVALIIC